MSWLGEFDDELRARGVRRGTRERLVAELADHLACGRGWTPHQELTRLGAPREIAGRCADELGSDDARSTALWAFGALALTAVAIVVSLAALGRLHYPGFSNGFSVALALPALAALLFGSQVALVAGLLAVWRALRRRGEPLLPGAEVALLRRRTTVALGAGASAAAGLALYVINDAAVLPAWWLALAGSLAGLATAALALAARGLARSSTTVVLASGPAGDVFDDLPPLRFLRGRPLALCAAVAFVSGLAVTLFEWHAEHSLQEGFQRGAVEAVAFVVCFALLARAVGARR